MNQSLFAELLDGWTVWRIWSALPKRLFWCFGSLCDGRFVLFNSSAGAITRVACSSILLIYASNTMRRTEMPKAVN